MLLLGYGNSLGQNLPFCLRNDPNICVVILVVIGVVLLDFNCDACQSPARAYLIDVSVVDDHSIGLSTFTVMAGAGGAVGYVLGGKSSLIIQVYPEFKRLAHCICLIHGIMLF